MTGVSLVMPVYNEAADLPDVLASIAAQDYPADALFLIVVDGGSGDGSVEIVRDWLERGPIRGEILHNPRRAIPISLNLGIAHARPADIIVRLDAHTTYDAAYVRTIVEAFGTAAPDVGCVGGPMLPAPETRYARRLVEALYRNPMGLGGAGFRSAGGVREVSGVYLGAWRPEAMRRVGGFDERWQANEDAELAARLREHGYRTLLIPLRSEYRVKRAPLDVVRQWARYGYWRAQTLRRHPRELSLRHLAPPIALGLLLAVLASPLRAFAALPLLGYLAAIVALRPPGEPLSVTLGCGVLFPACQVAWTVGLLRGLAAPPPRRRTELRLNGLVSADPAGKPT